ncbi:uncharacterized protein GGS22DRAFT_170465 [Annulohypoxylon maeteangense]|uniref:uncharacterized protein n=1 Tax=Annulohypoxylon maeteangense TaxID=1927788 RepID=UPI00200803A5|nr:uncharacterized protein GGS22DRAFT_170465 [Annulohypoxylon maeteangense]KAI0882213.1 hypothetical protein GGS22DRAFT_170465 [Annulohypoxylon maeteangense]
MNAHALLTAQGWRGTGHSLHPTSDDKGLKHHLLIKRNDDGRGLGSKKDHKQEAWWLNAFDQALKGIDTKTGTMKQTLRGGALEKITAKGAAGKYTGTSGLYSCFVKGGMMEGTVGVKMVTGLPTPPESGVGTPAATNSSTDEDEKEERKETKEERRARREARRLRKAEKHKRKDAEERAARKVEKKKAKKAERQRTQAGETKEERRARREARRKRKEEKRTQRAKSGG